MTPQEIFSKVITHLRKQGKAGSITGGCFYRTADGKSCAVGCLISSEEYLPKMEGQSIGGLLYYYPEVMSRLGLTEHETLLKELQVVHDNYPQDQWEEMWAKAAITYNLIVPPKDEA